MLTLLLLPHLRALLPQWRAAIHHPHPLGPVDPVPDPQPGNPLPPEPVGPHPTPM